MKQFLKIVSILIFAAGCSAAQAPVSLPQCRTPSVCPTFTVSDGLTVPGAALVNSLLSTSWIGAGTTASPDNERFIAQKVYAGFFSTDTISMLGDAGVADLVITSEGSQGAGTGARFGAYGGGFGAQVTLQAVVAEGSKATPGATLSGDSFFLGLNGHTGSVETGSKAAINMAATENWTPTANGASVTISATKIGSTSRRTIATFNENGLTLPANATSTGGIVVGGGTNVVYRCAGGTNDGVLSVVNTNPLCSGGVWTATALKLN